MTNSGTDTGIASGIPENKLAGYAYIAGIAGAMSVLGLGYIGAAGDVTAGGWSFFSFTLTRTPYQTAGFALALCAVAMLVPEFVIRICVDRGIIHVSRKLKNGEISKFIVECVVNFVFDVLILYVAITFYRYTSEYGYFRHDEYYRPWFEIMEIVWRYYLILGLPYIVITRALQHDPDADRRMPMYLLLKTLIWLVPRIERASVISNTNLFGMNDDEHFHEFIKGDGIIIRGILVKLFFIPIMTVFFMEHFKFLLNDWNYINLNLSRKFWSEFISSLDFYNISFTFLMSVDTALAWCGYVVSTRWIKNGNVSVEPTFFGWTVALLSYPPFQRTYGYYFSVPDERGFFGLPSIMLVALCAIISIFSYAIYASATVMFGLRFSNLTHRGILTKGPYRIVRHPAYAAKNLAWWFTIVPQIAFRMYGGMTPTVLSDIVGLVGLSVLYYFRAMTEEQHLARDPAYVEYQRRVPYRFIPGVI